MAKTTPAVRTETYHRYLDAAEQAFIRDGYEGASIRRISAAAGAPLGTLHHYWGNKESLFRDVCTRRFSAIQAEQLAALRALRDVPGQPSLEAVVRAMFGPPILAEADDPRTRDAIRMLYGRVLTEPSDVVKKVVRDFFREDTLLFRELLQRAAPRLDEDAFYWRLTCLLGAFIFALSFGDRVGYAVSSAGVPPGTDWRGVLDDVTGFVVRGMG